MKRWKRESNPMVYKRALQYWVVRQSLSSAVKSAVKQAKAMIANLQYPGIADKKR